MNTQNSNTEQTNQGREIVSTNYYNIRGHNMESMTDTDANGNGWQISTHKTGGGVVCIAIEGKIEGSLFSYEMFGSKRLRLADAPGACTEKKVREVHARGLVEFQKQMNSQEAAAAAPVYAVTVGQVIFTDGPFERKKRVIYEVTRPGHYRTVTLDGLELRQDDRIKDYKEKFGIGVYYNQGETLPASEIAALVESAKTATADREEAAKRAAAKAHTEREERVNKGREIVKSIPADAECVIVAKLREDKSDLQSDYHGYETKKTVYLAYSNHKRDLFPEMRKAAENFTETQHLGTGKGIFKAIIVMTGPETWQSNGAWYRAGQVSPWHRDRLPASEFSTQADAQNFINEAEPLREMKDGETVVSFGWKITETDIEHREKYSMGAGYYLGESKYSGWIITKQRLPMEPKEREKFLETLQEAAGAGAYFIPEEGKAAKADTNSAKAATHTPGTAGDVSIIDYSEKAIAVIGDTKPIKDELKALGGKFNFRLSCGPGWIFSKRKLEEVKTFLSNYAETPAPVQELKEEIAKGIEFFVKHDLDTVGHITEGTREAARVQGVTINEPGTDASANTQEEPGPELLALPPAAENQLKTVRIKPSLNFPGGVEVLANEKGHAITYANDTQAAQRELLETARGNNVKVYRPPFNDVVRFIQVIR